MKVRPIYKVKANANGVEYKILVDATNGNVMGAEVDDYNLLQIKTYKT